MTSQITRNDPCELRYELKCKIKKLTRYGQQGTSQGNSMYEVIVLIPDNISDTTHEFFSAWLPDSSKENVEVSVRYPYPIFGRGRCYVLRYADDLREPHLMVANVEVEEILKHKVGETMIITVLTASEDAEMDSNNRDS